MPNASAADGETRLLLVTSDPSLARAVGSALGPWAVTVVASGAAPLGSDMPLVATDARALAEREHVDAVAWISNSNGGLALWTYDVRSDQVVSRVLTVGPPYDEVHAASVALSLKTLLRSSAVAPPLERGERAPSLAPTASAPPVVVSARPPVSPPASTASALVPPKGRVSWLAQVGAGVRFGESTNAVLEPRLALLVGVRLNRLSLAAKASFGSGTTARSELYSLRLADSMIGATARYAIVDTASFSGGVAAAFDLKVMNASGDVGMQRLTVSDTYVNPALGGGAFGVARLGRWFTVGLSVDVSWLMVRQKFYVADQLAIDEHPLAVDMHIWTGFDL